MSTGLETVEESAWVGRAVGSGKCTVRQPPWSAKRTAALLSAGLFVAACGDATIDTTDEVPPSSSVVTAAPGVEVEPSDPVGSPDGQALEPGVVAPASSTTSVEQTPAAETGSSTTPADETVPPEPERILRAAVAALAASTYWSHSATISLEGLGDIVAVSSRSGTATHALIDRDGSIFEEWSRGGLTLVSIDGEPLIRFPQPSGTTVADSLDAAVLLDGVTRMPVVGIQLAAEATVITVSCDSRNELPEGFLLTQACGPDSGTEIVVHVDSQTSAFLGWEISGTFEFWPGEWASIQGSGELEPLDPSADLTIPRDFDDTSYRCVAQALGVSADDEQQIGEALSATTTEENRDLFTPCGFVMWPSGTDLNS